MKFANCSLRGKYLTWLFSYYNYHWIRIGRIIFRWEYGIPKIQYIGKAKNVTPRKESKADRYHPKG